MARYGKLFSSNNSEENTEESENNDTDQPDNEDENEDPKVMVRKTVEETKEYTEHTALVRYPDGSEEEITFDEMQIKENCIILENYKGYGEDYAQTCGSPHELRRVNGFDAEKFCTLSLGQISKFETINRETKEFEYEKPVRGTKRQSEVEEDETIIDIFE